VFNLITNSIQATSGDILSRVRASATKCPMPSAAWASAALPKYPSLPTDERLRECRAGTAQRPRYSILEAFVRTPRASRIEKETRQRAFELLEMVSLKDYVHEKAANLPYGLQRRLEMARAMAANPSLLLLDEPAAAMNEDECNDLISSSAKSTPKWATPSS
jgi:branched-chain amino acid transport system ATP-binding protein